MATDRGADSPTARGELGALLRGWRLRALLTQEQLAGRTGLSVRTISRLEAGRLRPRSESVRLLADALGLGDAERAMLTRAVDGRPGPPEPPAATIPVPRQLPGDVAGFTGRAEHLEQLDAMLLGDGGTTVAVISAIAGTAGVGKTALAVHWAHRAASRFPDGQLHVNLRGYASGPPVSPLQALAQLLQGLGVEADRVPVEVEAATGLYRSLVAGKRVLVVLDNARDAEQVRPLLPGGQGCMVVVTSRDRLTGLVASHSAHRLTLDMLPSHEAVELLALVLGEKRVEAEPEAAAELARLCGRLPLALRIAAANLAGQPEGSIGEYAAGLRGGDRLAGLEVEEDPEVGVRTAFDHSYALLDPDSRRLFRLLGLVPGPEVSALAAAALTGASAEQAARRLERLAATHLVEVRGPGRYGLHDLLRVYARQRADQEDDQPGRAAAVGRLLGWCLQAADAAATLLYPQALRLPIPGSEAGLPPAGFDQPATALAWLDAERANLVAAVQHTAEQGPRRLAWLLADTLRGYFMMCRHTVEWLAVASAGLTAATDEGDRQAQAAAQLSLSTAHHGLGRYPQAIAGYGSALTLARQAAWTEGEAATLSNLGISYTDVGDLQQAAEHYAQALTLNRKIGRRPGQANNLLNLGMVYWELGQLEKSAEHHTQALALHRESGARSGEASALNNLGEVAHDLGQLDCAAEHLTKALGLYREVGARFGEAYSLYGLAAVHRDAGRHAEALELARDAVALGSQTSQSRVQADALNTLGSIERQCGQPQQAIDHHQQALALARHTGGRYPEAGALLGLSAAHLALGNRDQAIEDAEQVLALAAKAGYQVLEGRAQTVLAAAHLAGERHSRAVEHARQALVLHRGTGHRLGQARTLVILGHSLHYAGDAADAVACWRQALALFTDIGSPEAEDVRALLQPEGPPDTGTTGRDDGHRPGC